MKKSLKHLLSFVLLCWTFGGIAMAQNDGGCIDYDNLTGSQVTCYYGSFENPAQYTGVANSRHTVITTDGTDANTNNVLHFIPDGFTSSVRLGNPTASHQAERIVYTYQVDTAQSDMLVLHYAAVLQNPTDANHSASDQPRFTYRILNSQGNEIDSQCYSANFVASVSLGWNSVTPGGAGNHGGTAVLWKDWTRVGLDLADLHGQTIQIELTTYDCGRQGHYGYAYFAISCDHKNITTTSCGGQADYSFEAPDGFDYRWYNASNNSATLSTTRYLHVTTPGTYICHMTFLGAQNSNCGFDMVAVASSRYPYAQCSSVMEDSLDNCRRRIRFMNSSIVTSDSAHLQSLGESCSSYEWSFGDGATSTEVNPTHDYSPGHYDVVLVAHIEGGCTDTLHYSLEVPNCRTTVNFDTTICPSALPFSWHGQTFTQADSLVLQLQCADGTDSIVTFVVRVLPDYHTDLQADLCENSTITLWGTTFDSGGAYEAHLTTTDGCDSAATITITQHPAYSLTKDDILCLGSIYRIGDTAVTHAGSHTIFLRSQYGCDSIIALQLTEATTFDTTIFLSDCERSSITFNGMEYHSSGLYTQTYHTLMGCDSLIHLQLDFTPRSQARIAATPNAYTPDQRYIRLTDQSANGNGRQWFVDGAAHSTLQAFTYHAEGTDPIEVMLISLNGNGCDDTATLIIPFHHEGVWAPNVITPSMGTNQTFMLKLDNILDGMVFIYTRQGEQVCEFDLLTGSWDGTHNGAPLPQGTYVWKVDYHSIDEPRQLKSDIGTVTLLR